MSGAKHRQKGDRAEREIVDLHKAMGVYAERYPLSGASRFSGPVMTSIIYALGREAGPLSNIALVQTSLVPSSDLIGRISNTAYIVDYKFGQGVRVRAIYPDGDEDVLNAQAMFYAAGAHHSLRKFLAGVDTFVLVILQPQSIEPDAEMISAVAVSARRTRRLHHTLPRAGQQAQSPEARLERGSHCRFCPAKPICPGAHQTAARSRPAHDTGARSHLDLGRRGQGHRQGRA